MTQGMTQGAPGKHTINGYVRVPLGNEVHSLLAHRTPADHKPQVCEHHIIFADVLPLSTCTRNSSHVRTAPTAGMGLEKLSKCQMDGGAHELAVCWRITP